MVAKESVKTDQPDPGQVISSRRASLSSSAKWVTKTYLEGHCEV